MSPLIGSSIITILGETIILAKLRRTFTVHYVVALGPSHTVMPHVSVFQRRIAGSPARWS
jgi:hypothetical protein